MRCSIKICSILILSIILNLINASRISVTFVDALQEETALLEEILFEDEYGNYIEYPQENDVVVPKIYLKNSTGTLLEGKLIFAAYDNDSSLIYCNAVNVSQAVARKRYMGNSFTYRHAGYVKVFLLNGFDKISPIAASRVYKNYVAPYSKSPDYVASTNYSLTVNNTSIDVQKFADFSFARFSFAGIANMKVTAPSTISTFSILPGGYNIEGICSNNNLTFSIDGPKYLFVEVDQLGLLIVLADEIECDAPKISGENVINLQSYLVAGRDENVPITSQIQAAIDATSMLDNNNGGILYVPNGKYVAAQLKVKSNVHIYLESGAVLKSAIDFSTDSYPLQSESGDSSFIYIEDANNVKITGRGFIDGDGYNGRVANDNFNIKLIRTVRSSNIVFKDIYMIDASKWTIHLLYSDNIEHKSIKIINDLRGELKNNVLIPVVRNTDGVVIDASNSVSVEDSFIYTGDDAITPKVSNIMRLKRPCYDMMFTNNVLYTLKAALKVGDESSMDIYDIVFNNNDVVRADRFIALWVGGECALRNVYIIDNRSDFIGGDYEKRYFTFRIYLKNAFSKPGTMDNIVIKNLTGRNPADNSSIIEGYSELKMIKNITFENVVINGKNILSASDVPFNFVNAFYENIVFK